MGESQLTSIKDNHRYAEAIAHLKTLAAAFANAVQQNGVTSSLTFDAIENPDEPEKAAFFITRRSVQQPKDLIIVFNTHGDGRGNFLEGAAFIKHNYAFSESDNKCAIPEIVAIDDHKAFKNALEAYKIYLDTKGSHDPEI